MTNFNSNDFPLKEIVQKAIQNEVQKIADEEYENAAKRIAERKSGVIADVVLRIQDYVSYERMGTDLRIIIKKEEW